MKKSLSIIIPVYNDERVANAIESVLSYKNLDLEIIVIDGGSKDNTIQIIKKYIEDIEVFISEPDDGINDAINKGISKAIGEWIMVLASDDYLLINPLSIIKREENTNIDIICGSIIQKNIDNRYRILKSDMDLKKLDYYCSLRHPASFFKRNVFEQYGMYDTQINIAGDRDMFLKVYKNGGNIRVIDDVVVMFSIGGVSTKNEVTGAYMQDLILSDRYKVNRLQTRVFYIRRVVNYFVGKIKSIFHLQEDTEFYSIDEVNEQLKEMGMEVEV